MKKLLILTLFILVSTCSISLARTQYDSTGRHIIYDDSLRAKKHSASQVQTVKIQAAAAAKINYEEDIESVNEVQTKSNYYQDSTNYKNKHNIK